MKRSELRRVSPKQAKRNRDLARLKLRLLEERGAKCEAQWLYAEWFVHDPYDPRVERIAFACSGRPDELHHVVKRSRQSVDRAEDLMLLCNNCHRFTETDPDFATELGLLRPAEPVSRFFGQAS